MDKNSTIMNILDSHPTLGSSLQIFGLTLFHSLWQGMIIGILCWLMLKMLHRNVVSLRFAVAYISLLLLFFSFIGTYYLQSHISSATAPDIAFDDITFNNFDTEIISSPGTAPSQENWWAEATAFYQILSQKLITYAPVIVAGWLLGFSYYTLRLTAGLYQIRQMKRRSHRPEGKWISMLQHLQKKIKIQRRLQLLISSQTNTPLTVGWLKPVILLPPSIFTELSAEQLEAILIHELAHIKRQDYLLNIIQSIIEVFLFFNPIYWYIATVLEQEREQACDQIALNTLPHPIVYARALTRLAELHSAKFSPDIAISAIGKRYLQQRIRNIMQYVSYPSLRPKQTTFKWYQPIIIIIALGILLTTLAIDVQGHKQFELSSSVIDSEFIINKQVSDQEKERKTEEKDQNVLSTNASVLGKVIDAQTGQPLSGVNVMVKNKKTGTVTRSNGRFTIQADLDKDTLTFELSGYQTVQTSIHFTSVNIALQKIGYHPLPFIHDDKNILYIIDQRSAVAVSAPADDFLNRKLYDIGPENIVSLKVTKGHEKQVWLDKFAGNLPNKNQYEVVLIQTKMGVEKEANKKAEQKNKFTHLTAQLNKNIRKRVQKLDNALKINTNQSLTDSSQNMLYIINGVYIKDDGQKVLNGISPQDILSIEVRKGFAKLYFKDGEEREYDGTIKIKTKNKLLTNEILNEDNKAFEKKLIAFPNQVDERLYVQFEIGVATHIRVEVASMNGQTIALLTNQTYEPGVHLVNWNTTSQIPGWYIVRVLKEGKSYTRKILVE